MKWLWAHRYSLVSIGFSLANFLFIFGALNGWFWITPVVLHTELYRRILSIHASMAVASMGLGALVLQKSDPERLGSWPLR